MTNEEAIVNLKMISLVFVVPVTKEQRKLIDDTFDIAIKALEQEPVLDKIRAEIAEEQNDCMVKEQIDTAYGLELALGIIDKYNGESEDAE